MKLKRIMKKVIASTLVSVMAVTLAGEYTPVEKVAAASIEIRENVNTPLKDGHILVGVKGVDYTSKVADVLKTINDERYKACQEGVINPATGKALTPSDYYPLKIGTLCTSSAKIRAAEASIYLDHTRPNGEICHTVIRALHGSDFGLGWTGENLAWYSEKNTTISGWIKEKSDYVNKVSGAVVGHYEALISTNYSYVGISSFNPDNDTQAYDWTCTEATFAGVDTEVSSPENARSNDVIAKVEIPLSKTFNQSIIGDSMVNVGDEKTYECVVSYDNKQSGNRRNKVYDCPVYDQVTWESTDKSVIEFDGNKFIAKKLGRATIKATIGSGSSAISLSKEVLVVNKNTVIDHAESLGKITVESYEKPVLPKTANVVLSDGSKIAVDVTWDSYDEENLKTNLKSNEFTVNGKAYGYDVKQVIHVNAAKVVGLRAYNLKDGNTYDFIDEVRTPSGKEPSLPKYGYVTLSNGLSYYACELTWDKTDDYKIREGGTFTLKAKTPKYFNTDDGVRSFDIEIKLIVEPAFITSEKLEFESKTLKYNGKLVLPRMYVTWSNGDNSYEDVTWNLSTEKMKSIKAIISNTNGGSFKVTGKFNGKSVVVKYTVNKKSSKTSSSNSSKVSSKNTTKGKTTAKKKTTSKVKVYKKGKILKDKYFVYKVIKSASRNGKKAGKLKIIRLRKKKLKKVTIRATKKFGGLKYKITVISKKAFRGCKRLKRIVFKSKNLKKKYKKRYRKFLK